jgi:hypothetical protein
VSRLICCYADCHYAECRYAECRYAKCRYAECHGARFRGALYNQLHSKKHYVPLKGKKFYGIDLPTCSI